jgi:predicted DNA-binding ribbon-helix-helix protein
VIKGTRGHHPAQPRSTDLAKHSLVIAGHRTSISLERAFWEGLQKIANEREMSIAALVASVDAERGDANLSSALRVFLLRVAAEPAASTQTKAPLPEQGR